MIISALQMNVIKNAKEQNLQTVSDLIGDNIVDLVALPELFSTGYFYTDKSEILSIAEEIPNGRTTRELLDIAAKKKCHIIGTIVEKERDKLYITAVVVGPDNYIGKQRKRHLTTGELAFYTPGEESVVFDINGCKIGVVICFDGWFPESVRELTIRGAQIVCHSALITSPKTLDIMRVRAIENKVFLMVANGISSEVYQDNVITFRGDSRIIDYNGNILAEAGKSEKLLWAAVDEGQTIRKDLEDCENIIFEIHKHGMYKVSY